MASDLDLAIDSTARHYRNGKEQGFTGMARRLGQNPQYFSNKVSASYDGAHVTPNELVAIMEQADDYSILHTIARSLHHPHVCIPLGDYAATSDIALLDLHLELTRELGETADTIRTALSKGSITRRDFDAIDREMHEDIQAMFELRARLEGLIVD